MNAPALNPSTETAPMQPADFIAAMGKCATEVTVITTDGPAGRFGVTVSAMSSVSAEPPLLLVCVNRNNLAYAAIDHNRCFCVNLVAAEQQAVAQVFAGQLKAEPGDRFDCRIEQQINLDTHTVFVGRVVAVQSREGSPLAYSQRSFCNLKPRQA